MGSKILAWVLADSASGYTWGWKLYTGKERDRPQKGLAHSVVMELVSDERLKHRGYIVFTDNFYSSPALFKTLVQEVLEPLVLYEKTEGEYLSWSEQRH